MFGGVTSHQFMLELSDAYFAAGHCFCVIELKSAMAISELPQKDPNSGVAGGGVCVVSEGGRGSGGCAPGKIFHFPPRNNGVL